MRVTVAALSGTSDIDIRHETQLVKSALLYADRVTLASLEALMLASIASFASADPSGRAAFVAGFVGDLNEASAKQYGELRQRRDLSPQERRLLKLMDKKIAEASDEMSATVEELLANAGAGELGSAIQAGLVDIHDLSAAEESDLSPSAIDLTVNRMTELLRESVSGSAETFPLFDDGAGNMLRAMVEEGKLADAHKPRAVEAGIAGRLIGGLEAFPHAEMDVILDVRERLRDPLVRFRAALGRASTEFASAAWDEGFAREVDDLYRREVAPALLEINDGLNELGVRPTLLRLTSSKEALIATAATLGLAAAGGVGHSELPQLLYSAPGAGAIAVSVGEARQRRKIRGEAQQNAFYFLYQANRNLDD